MYYMEWIRIVEGPECGILVLFYAMIVPNKMKIDGELETIENKMMCHTADCFVLMSIYFVECQIKIFSISRLKDNIQL